LGLLNVLVCLFVARHLSRKMDRFRCGYAIDQRQVDAVFAACERQLDELNDAAAMSTLA
jgi:hypothetical protein